MKVTSETLPERQVLLEIAVDDERHHAAIEKAYKKLAPAVRVAGFRPGKAPRNLIERQLGRHRLLDEAMDILVPEVYKEAIEEQDLDPVAQPALELVSHEPFVIKATVPLKPSIELGDYTELRVPLEKRPVTQEEVDAGILSVRQRYGTIEPVDRPAAKGDIIRGDIKAETDEQVLIDEKDFEFRVTDEGLAMLPSLVDHIVGLSKGADVEVQADGPEDFPNPRIAGKTVRYHIKIHDVKEDKLAEWNDDLVKEVGEGFDTIDQLADHIRADVQAAADSTIRREYEEGVIDALVDRATIEYPGVLLDHEIDHVLEDEANLDARDPKAQELYLARVGKSEEEVREAVKPDAERRLLRGLVLSKFAEAENIKVLDEDVATEVERMAASAGEQAASIRELLSTGNLRDSIARNLYTQRVMDRLVAIVSGEASAEPAESPAEETSAEEKPKRRRSAPRKADSQ